MLLLRKERYAYRGALMGRWKDDTHAIWAYKSVRGRSSGNSIRSRPLEAVGHILTRLWPIGAYVRTYFVKHLRLLAFVKVGSGGGVEKITISPVPVARQALDLLFECAGFGFGYAPRHGHGLKATHRCTSCKPPLPSHC